MKKSGTVILRLGVVLALACLTGAAAGSQNAREKYEKSFSLAPGGKVSLENVNGSLQVRVWDKNEVKVEALKYADTEADLRELSIKVDSENDMVAIRTQYPDEHGRHHSHGLAVDYILTVPKNANLDKLRIVNGKVDVSGVSGDVSVSSVNGVIEARDLRGSCELETVNGTIKADFISLRRDADVRIKAVNGSIVVRLPAKPDANVDASTSMGSVSDEFGLKTYGKDDRDSFVEIGARLHGKLGNGGARISLKTVNGSIELLK